jgi:3-(3-hydroxy-phenyl)propionate hydroxylase
LWTAVAARPARTIGAVPDTAAYALPEYAYVAPPEITRGPQPRYPLVIVGGGLVGLTLAADLASRGVACVLLDEDHTVGVRGASSRGIVYVQRTLEVMARLGVYERIAAKGVTWSRGEVLAGDEVLYAFDYQPQSVSAQPPFVNLQQFHLEAFLVERLGELGLTDLRWDNRVTDVEAHADHVTLHVATPDGPYALEADWVVDAEGVHSLIRQRLKLPAHTERGDDRWCITDVRFGHATTNVRRTWVEAPFNDGRAVWQHLMAEDVWRLDFQMAPDSDPDTVSRPDVARERVQRMLGPGVPFELVWVGPYSYRTMLMERFRHGRLLFVGDAAHAKSPFGARGGNSGIHDADNLGWKLALLLQGRADERILDTYDLERHRAAEENIRITSRSGRFLRPRSEIEFLFRRAVLDLAHEHRFARPMLNTGRLCAPHHYGGLPTVGPGAHDGKSVPNVRLERDGRPTTLIDLLREANACCVAFVFGDLRPDAGGLPLVVQRVGRDVDDVHGHLAAHTGVAPGGVALLRPDGHLAAALPTADAAPLHAALRRTLGQQPPTR